MLPKFKTLPSKNLIGQRIRMCFAENKTRMLWQEFMPRKKEIKNCIGTDLFSLEIYDDTSFFKNFDPKKEFEKWAAVEVTDFNFVPDKMETLVIPSGLYAVFNYKGSANDAANFYRYIFASWLPGSDYILDDRPHFAVMGEKYKKDSEDSEEDIWIPVRSVPDTPR